MAAQAARNSLFDVADHVAETKEAVILRRRGRDVAAVISMADYRRYRRLLLEWEDRY